MSGRCGGGATAKLGSGLALDRSPPPIAGTPPAATMAASRHLRIAQTAPSLSSYRKMPDRHETAALSTRRTLFE